MILGLDATTEHLHLALVDGQRSWSRRVSVGLGKSHSLTLLPELDALVREAGTTPAGLTGVCACVGPGGFTSLRIGVATAEGLGLDGVPTWGFSAFELRAAGLAAAEVPAPCWILLDGQRGEAFHQRWEADGAAHEAGRHPLAELAERLKGEPWWAPEGFRPKAEAVLGPCPITVEDEGAATLAGLVRLCRSLPSREPEDPLVPFYLRETDAEVNFPEASRHLPEALRRGVSR